MKTNETKGRGAAGGGSATPRTVTYGVRGLVEWQAEIPMGYRKLNVTFSGGIPGGYNRTPATFTTSDPVLQRLIEQSHWFRKGRIIKLKGTS